ncbi:Immediate-early protein 2 [Streptacidiphilus anmyonensis]|uniref:Immediate-early protein 2 n=1 Tax=Streptacidiphilus anmyonensis TaxID=405782 RepID=UPI0005A82B7A|nr:Immediate-early protein 2 [Streptacidiphilus anmyonensis]
MATFLLVRTVPLTPDECFARLTDWSRHGDRVPFTRVGATRGSGRAAGDVILARTALGPTGFDDPMEIVVFEPPGVDGAGLCRLEKRGRVVRGWAEFRVRASGNAGGAQVVWVEEIRVRGLPAALDPLVAGVARLVFGRVLEALLN